MKKVQVRLSEQTHEDLVRVADGRPLQQFLERMIDEAIQRAVCPPRERKSAKVDLKTDPEATTDKHRPGDSLPPPVDKYHVMLAERQQRINRGLG